MSRPPIARRQPQQERARERVRAVLDAAREVLATQGLGGFTMSAVAAQAGLSVPSLYRYFADREEIVGALAQRYFDDLHALLDTHLAGLRDAARAARAVAEVLEAYHHAFLADPALALLWGGALADPRLAELNAADSRRNGALLAERLGPFSALDDATLLRRCVLASQLTLATVCFALTMPREEGTAYVAEFGGWADRILFGRD